MRIAVLGLGRMGSAMAQRLHAFGFDLVLWNRTPGRAEALALGPTAPTPAEAARGVDLVLSSLTDATAVREVYLGPAGASEGAAGQPFVEMSTTGPDVLRELAPALQERGSDLVSAPVLGTVTAVQAGKLVILAGGAQDEVARVRRVLEVLGEVQHVGDLDAAAALKVVANSMLGLTSLAAAELLAAAACAGLDRDLAFSTLARYAPGLGDRRAGYVEGRYLPAMFALRDLQKDLDLGLGLFHCKGASTPLTALARELVAESARTSPESDISALASRYPGPPPRRRAGWRRPGMSAVVRT